MTLASLLIFLAWLYRYCILSLRISAGGRVTHPRGSSMLLSHRSAPGRARTLALMILLLCGLRPRQAPRTRSAARLNSFRPMRRSTRRRYACESSSTSPATAKPGRRSRKYRPYQSGWQLIQAQLTQPNSPLDIAQQMLELPENQQLVELLADMDSQRGLRLRRSEHVPDSSRSSSRPMAMSRQRT